MSDDAKIEKIEVNFGLPVELSSKDSRALNALVDRICKSNCPDGWVFWPAGQGSKPSFSFADAMMLGQPGSYDPGIPSGDEPTWDDSVYSIDCTAREARPEEIERDKAKTARRERWLASTEYRVGGWGYDVADALARCLSWVYRQRRGLTNAGR